MSRGVVIPGDVAERMLIRCVEQLSEERWCAGWYHDIEFVLWEPTHWAGWHLNDGDPLLGDIIELAGATGRWPMWGDCGPTTVPHDEFAGMYRDWLEARAARTGGES